MKDLILWGLIIFSVYQCNEDKENTKLITSGEIKLNLARNRLQRVVNDHHSTEMQEILNQLDSSMDDLDFVLKKKLN